MDCAEKAAIVPMAVPTAPKFLGPLCATVAFPKEGALDLKTKFDIRPAAGGTKDAQWLLASSSSACFLVRAHLSDQVNSLAPPSEEEELGLRVCCNCFSKAAKGFLSFLGAGRLTGQ